LFWGEQRRKDTEKKTDTEKICEISGQVEKLLMDKENDKTRMRISKWKVGI